MPLQPSATSNWPRSRSNMVQDLTQPVNMDRWYEDTPLGQLDDEVSQEERRHLELMMRDDLTEAEQVELDTLTNLFITQLNEEVDQIKF